jgi:hypothetical protein
VKAGRAGLFLAIALSLAFLAQGLLGNRDKSLTWDEPRYIAAGYASLTQSEFRLNPSHPPFLQELMALPLLPLELEIPPKDVEHWLATSNPPVEYGRALVYGSGNDVRQIEFWARLPSLLMGAGLILAIYLWGRGLLGETPALLASAIAALSPNLLAHAKLATLDLGSTAFVFAAVWTFWSAAKRDRIWGWVVCGVVGGLALLTKFTALLLAPMLALLGFGCLVLPEPALGWKSLLRGLGIVGLAAFFVVGAGYNFSFDWPAYWRGITSIYVDLAPAYPNYLLGEFSTDPWWYYHLAALGFKVPVPALLLLVFAAVTAWADRTRRGAEVFLLVPVLCVLGASCFDHVNLGVRRVLPALPFLFLFAGRFLSGEVRLRTLRLIVAGLLVAWMAAEALRIYPHHLAYFNSVVGSPERGASYLDDSNIDWGQDLPALAAWQEGESAARPLRLLYFGSASPAAYGVESVDFSPRELTHPKPGYYAISVHNLIRLKLRRQRAGPAVDWLDRYEPVARAGHSIYIYRFPEP